MGIRRYDRVDYMASGRMMQTPQGVAKIQHNVRNGRIRTKKVRLKEGERLDHIAAQAYGNGKLWWVIAAASGIGWGLQPPPDTRILVPINLADIVARAHFLRVPEDVPWCRKMLPQSLHAHKKFLAHLTCSACRDIKNIISYCSDPPKHATLRINPRVVCEAHCLADWLVRNFVCFVYCGSSEVPTRSAQRCQNRESHRRSAANSGNVLW